MQEDFKQEKGEMNTVIEPCCYSKQLTNNIEEAEKGGGISHFFSFSDWDTDQLIPFVMASVSGCEAVVCLVQLNVRTIYVLSEVLRRTFHDRESGEDRYVVKHITLITQPSRTEPEKQREEIRTQLGKYIGEGRVTICEDNIGFRCVAAGNGKRHLVIQGSINQGRMEPCCQMFTMTTTKRAYDMAMDMLASKARTKRIYV